MKETKPAEHPIKGQRPNAMGGLRHVALFVGDLDAALHFYVGLLGMLVEWEPDADNVYLTSGNDNLALHRLVVAENINKGIGSENKLFKANQQRLDHIGFIIDSEEEVDVWYEFLKQNHVVMKTEPKIHRDGARSFYCLDPAGTLVQIIYHPPISGKR